MSEGNRAGDEAPRPRRPSIQGSPCRGPARDPELGAGPQAMENIPDTLPDQAPSRHRVSEVTTTPFKYVLGKLIGEGPYYGRVYLAVNVTTGDMLVVKQVEDNDPEQANAVQALKAELKTLKGLQHPHIVKYLGYEETFMFRSMFLEYVPGDYLRSTLKKYGKFDDVVTKSFAWQIIDGLEYLHSKEIIHRSIEPESIFVEATGICKISDFSIATKEAGFLEEGSQHAASWGKIFWMAPESLQTGFNFKSDIWSVGCVVLEMWSGMRPWVKEESEAVVMCKLYENALPPLPTNMKLSDCAMDFRFQCFAINPGERPSALQLKRHPYLEIPPGWQFKGFTEWDYYISSHRHISSSPPAPRSTKKGLSSLFKRLL